MSAGEREKARQLLRDLETAGIIRKSKSKYCSSTFLKTKKSGSVPRLLVDYKKVNDRIAADQNAVARIDTIMEALQRAKWYSVIDLAAGYYQFPLTQNCQHITAFRLDSLPLMEYTVLPQGLKISASAMTRAVYDIFENELFKIMTAYLDDICVYGQSFDEELQNLERVLKKLEAHNFRLNTEKAFFFQRKIKLLGMEIENGKIMSSDENISAIANIRTPKTVKQVRGLISSFSFFRKFMPNFTQIAAPILKLLQGKNDGKEKITWLKEHEDALNELKSRIISKPILQIFDPDRETFLQTDARSHAIGAVLSQRDPADGQIKPVSYFSEKLSPRKKTLSSYDLELIALERSLKFYRKYLFLKKFKVFTDHKNLVYGRITEAATLNTSRLARITDVLNTFNFEIEHVKGTNNAVADMLSRQINHDKINAIKKIEEDRKNNKFIQN